jgi:hypothetical protein
MPAIPDDSDYSDVEEEVLEDNRPPTQRIGRIIVAEDQLHNLAIIKD